MANCFNTNVFNCFNTNVFKTLFYGPRVSVHLYSTSTKHLGLTMMRSRQIHTTHISLILLQYASNVEMY